MSPLKIHNLEPVEPQNRLEPTLTQKDGRKPLFHRIAGLIKAL